MMERTALGSLWARTTPADSIATSVPVPIAMPTSARARAGASLTPSPTIATRSPRSCSSATALSLSSGSTSAKTTSMTRSATTASATWRASPVGLFNQPLDAGEPRLLSYSRDPDPDGRIGCYRAGHHLLAHAIRDGFRLPRFHPLVELGLPFHDLPPGRNPPARATRT